MSARYGPGCVGISVGVSLRFGSRMPLILDLVARHCAGDWGDLCPDDRRVNEQALCSYGRVLGVYNVSPDETVWITSEANDGFTTVFLPEEY